MTINDRVDSIDIMKGISLLLMIFFADQMSPMVPEWFSKISPSANETETINPAFYLFLFAFGMTIPYAISKRINKGLLPVDILKQVLVRTIVYLLVGVLMINSGRVEPVLTGFGKNLWGLLMFIALFLVWNRYPESDNKFFTVSGLRIAGLAILVFLVFKFRSGTLENNGSLITGWWGIVGLIGWGYLVGSLAYSAVNNSILATILIWLSFLALHILSNLSMLEFLNPVKAYFGVVIDGYIPFVVLTGVLASMLIRRFPTEKAGILNLVFAGTGIALIATEFVLKATGVFKDHLLLICGISLLVFSILFFIVEIKKIVRWGSFLRPAWESSITAYIVLFLLYNLLALTGIRLLFYKDYSNPILFISGSITLTAIVILITAFLNRMNIRLKI